MLQNLRVFSEYPSPAAPVVTPLIRIDMWYPKSHGFWGSVAMMKGRLADQIAQLEATPEGDRAIMLWWLLTRETYVAKGADPLAIYEAGSIPTRRPLAMLKPFSDEIKRRGITLDLAFIDNEGGFGLFDIGQTRVRRIMRSARARNKMPAAVRAINGDDLDQARPGYPAAKTTWDDHANKLRYDALKRITTQSGYFDVRAGGTGPIQSPSVVNFWSTNPTFPIYDYNGWRLLGDTCMDGRSSGPSCYLGFAGARYAQLNHYPMWNDFINLVNHVRSCLGRPGSVVHPVLANPWFAHPWMQEQMIAHMVRTGINWRVNRCAFLYWNANNPQLNDPILAAAVQRHDYAYPMLRNLPEIPLDVDTVTTADFTTRYSDFLTNVPN